MNQYSSQYQVGQNTKRSARDGLPLYSEINRAPRTRELDAARAAARQAGLWRLDQRAESIGLVI